MDITIAVTGVLALIAAVVAIGRTKRGPVRTLLIVAAPVLAVCLAVWWVFLRADVLTAIWVYAPNAPDGTGEFRIDVPNTRVLMTGASNTFRPRVSEEELFGAMRDQHPGTIVTGSMAEVVEKNQGYVLYPDPDAPGVYTLQVEVISLTRGNASYHLPFPIRSTSDLDSESWVFRSTCDSACLTEYYRQFSNVKVIEGTFAIALPSGSFVLRTNGPGMYQVTGP
jgi:hypothetical protein